MEIILLWAFGIAVILDLTIFVYSDKTVFIFLLCWLKFYGLEFYFIMQPELLPLGAYYRRVLVWIFLKSVFFGTYHLIWEALSSLNTRNTNASISMWKQSTSTVALQT